MFYGVVSRAQKISTVVDTNSSKGTYKRFTRSKNFYCCRYAASDAEALVSRAQKISTVVDLGVIMTDFVFHALKKFLLL